MLRTDAAATGHDKASRDPGVGMIEEMVALPDGRRIRTVLAGRTDGPLVVFEAGMSAAASSWVHTQREISQHARTLSYDRAGYGGSDLDDADRSLERLTDDLTAVLDARHEQAPVVLVGHSWGGPVLRLFAHRAPERVAGLVFVDASLWEAMPEWNARLAVRSFAVMAVLAKLGGMVLMRRAALPHGMSPEISERDRGVMNRDNMCAQAMRAGGREAKHILAALPTMRRLQDEGTPDVPTACVYGGRVDRGMKTLRPALNETATALMEASPQGRMAVIPEAGHLVPQEAPGDVRDIILDVLAQATASHRGSS